VSDSEADFYLAPGASLLYGFDSFFVGADLRFMFVMAEETIKTMTIMANGGMRF
jgi:hypothetical protein